MLRSAAQSPTKYDGAKDYFLYEDVDDREHMIAFVQATCRELPIPKPKRRRERPDRCRLTIKRSIRNFISRPKSRSCWKPPMNYVAVRGHGDPNAQDGEYQAAIGMLYAVAFTIKMSYKGTHQIPGYFEYVVPPLEGLWWQEGQSRVDYAHKETFSWIAMIRLPEFVTKQEFDWAVWPKLPRQESWISARKWSTLLMMKACACSACTLATMIPSPQRSTRWSSLRRSGTIKLTAPPLAYTTKFTSAIPRRTAPEKCKTVIREPVCKIE